jgi:hypothetical protein
MGNTNSHLNVSVLGAGASASCGIALTKDLFRESMRRLSNEEPKKARKVDDLLKYLYGDFRVEYRNYPNIEDFLNILETASLFNSQEFIESTLFPKEKISEVNSIVLRAVTDYISGFKTHNGQTASVEKYIGKHVPDGTVIITFNWDLTVELALAMLCTPRRVQYSYSEDNVAKLLTLLKPHGSINWFSKKVVAKTPGLQGKNFGEIFVVENPIESLLANLEPDLTPKIVAPVFSKDFSGSQALKKTWTSVYTALRNATKLTVLGYSLPKEDQFAKFVFRRALRNNLLAVGRKEKPALEMDVINPDEATEGTFARVAGGGGVNFKFHRSKFEDYVDSL